MVERFAEVLGRGVRLRPGTSDQQVFDETFGGLFHVPPDWMPVPRTVLDLGANIGLVAAHYRALWPDARIVCVEPDPVVAVLCAENSGCEVDVCAVGFADGRGELSGGDSYRQTVRVGSGPVVVRSLDSLIARHFGGEVDFVKMDVEGAEWEIIEYGGMLGFECALIELHERFEGHSDADMLYEAQGYLHDSGFLSMPHRIHPRAVFAWRG